MLSKLKAKIFERFASWCINRALRTPYRHMLHEDGAQHLHSYWLFRFGNGRPNGDGEIHPLFAVRVNQLVSSEESLFHDDACHSLTVVLRGSVTEVKPQGFELWRDRIRLVTRYHGFEPTEYRIDDNNTFGTGDAFHRKAWCFHYFTVPEDAVAWMLTITGPKRQVWGYLADGFVKVPARMFLERRRQRQDQSNGKTR